MDNPNLITRTPGAKPTGRKTGGIPPALIVSLIIIILSAAVYGAFFGTSLLFQARADAAEKTVTQKKAELSQAQSQAADALSFVARLASLQSLTSGHTYWSGLLNDIAARTDKRVQYISLRGNEKSNTITLEARASDYGAVERELVSLNDSPMIKKAIAKNIRYNIDSHTQIVTVNFDIQIEIAAGALKTVPSTYEIKSQGGTK